jgi:NAD(P)-dependent dehydrogenase (short-subunit alcohol dehydrogenase family)
MYQAVGPVDAVVSAAGLAKFGSLATLSDEDFAFCLANKLMGQFNLIRFGFDQVRDGGSFAFTSGVLARAPMVGSAAMSLINAGLEGFARAAALEAPRGIRVNVISPPWVEETLLPPGPNLTAAPNVISVCAARLSQIPTSGFKRHGRELGRCWQGKVMR